MLAALLVKHLALDQKDLGDVWEIQIPIERLRAPDAPGLNAAMILDSSVDRLFSSFCHFPSFTRISLFQKRVRRWDPNC